MNTEPIIPVAPRADGTQTRVSADEDSKARDEARERAVDAAEPVTREQTIRADSDDARNEPAENARKSPTRADGRLDEAQDTSYLTEQVLGPTHERWQQIQAVFVDDPRKSVSEAHELVGQITQRIVDAFARERSGLEQQWSRGDDVSTEELRVCLQRYRAFFSRLLPSANKFDGQS